MRRGHLTPRLKDLIPQLPSQARTPLEPGQPLQKGRRARDTLPPLPPVEEPEGAGPDPLAQGD